MCVCVCVCVCERERERERYFKELAQVIVEADMSEIYRAVQQPGDMPRKGTILQVKS